MLNRNGLFGIVQLGAAAVAEILGNDHGNGGGQQVQGRAADGLVRFQVDGSKGQKQAVHDTGQRSHQDRDQHHQERRHVGRKHGQGQNTGHTADALRLCRGQRSFHLGFSAVHGIAFKNRCCNRRLRRHP